MHVLELFANDEVQVDAVDVNLYASFSLIRDCTDSEDDLTNDRPPGGRSSVNVSIPMKLEGLRQY